MATNKTATPPKRRHAKTSTHPKRRQPKRRHFQKAVLVVAVLDVFWLSPFWMCRRFGVSPFWVCRRFGCRRFGVSPFWFVPVLVVAVLDLSPFWHVSNKTDKSLLSPVLHVNCIYHFVPHVIYSLWICTFAITKFINKILRNQIQYRYISTQIFNYYNLTS